MVAEVCHLEIVIGKIKHILVFLFSWGIVKSQTLRYHSQVTNLPEDYKSCETASAYKGNNNYYLYQSNYH